MSVLFCITKCLPCRHKLLVQGLKSVTLVLHRMCRTANLPPLIGQEAHEWAQEEVHEWAQKEGVGKGTEGNLWKGTEGSFWKGTACKTRDSRRQTATSRD